MTTQDISILERKSGEMVPATFYYEVTETQLIEAESQWKPIRLFAAEKLRKSGKDAGEICQCIQHVRWDWANKAACLVQASLAQKCFGIKLGQKWQGLIMIDLAMHRTQIQADFGKPIVYVEFLETAPWNIKGLVEEPFYGLTGQILMRAAIRLSIAEGFSGRVGLLALPQAEGFYKNKIGMQCVEGAGSQRMEHYELTQVAARSFLDGGQ